MDNRRRGSQRLKLTKNHIHRHHHAPQSPTERGVEGPSLWLSQGHLKLVILPGAPQLDEHERSREDIGNTLNALIDHEHVLKRHSLGKGKKQVQRRLVHVTCCSIWRKSSAVGQQVGVRSQAKLLGKGGLNVGR